MEHLNNFDHSNFLPRRGTVTLVTLFAILGLLVLIVFVGNIGHGVHRKIETQNAADAASITSAQWMARGMNAITATNHMLGEVTAIVTIHEALGGPEVDAGIEASTVESRVLDNTINNLLKFAYIRGLPTYGLSPDGSGPISQADKEFIEFVAGRMASDAGKHKAFATIYDSKITLKKKFARWLITKGVANLGLFVPPPWGYGSAAAAFGVHLYATKEIAGITKEWLILSALEEIVVRTKDLKVKVLEEQLIPALAEHAALVAADSDSPTSALGGGLVGIAIQDSLERLHPDAELMTYPRPSAIRLPVEPEPKPSLQGGPNELEWDGGAAASDSDFEIDILKIIRNHNKQKRNINRRINRLQQELRTLEEQNNDVETLLENDALANAQEQQLREELLEIDRLSQQKQGEIEKRRVELVKMESEFQSLMQNVSQYQSSVAGRSGNLSDSPGHLPAELDQKQERYSQWVRATWPYLDTLRAPILAQFNKELRRSGAKKHFTKWTNRYALVKSWQFRSGYRFEKSGQGSGRWSESLDVEPLHMFVMKDAFDGQGQEQKGREPWTKADDRGKQMAEVMFTLVGLAHRDFRPKFAPEIFSAPHDRGMTTYAQAILYNANQQEVTTRLAPSSVQPRAGWDTLNWDPVYDTPEWGSLPQIIGAKWPWEIFSSARKTDSVRVKLNWQAKLMPATHRRIAAAALDHASDDLGKTLGLSVLHFKGMSSH